MNHFCVAFKLASNYTRAFEFGCFAFVSNLCSLYAYIVVAVGVEN